MKILCIGRNYVKHIEELNNQVPSEPVIFAKPDSALLLKNKPFFIPDFASDFHHEVELVVKINRIGKNIAPQFAHRYYDEVALGIDFTARDLQAELKSKGLPWEKAKAFDGSAVLSSFISKERFDDIQNINFHLEKNNEKVQQGNTGHMIFPIDQIISHVSQFFTLKIGDLIYTGTPAGVGPVAINDRLKGYIEDELMFDFLVK
ncbi:fumarylacetoacetate hydrolase family protein [Carboxylicivirga sediminis]|uniref:Fumarylacetoacetate hydrolase family protein n=1 Tax=Carboxylicivirga sediminis TaxID=2006564 RepID=A0A941F2U2_9BACT|nr:fumarylacetoacetate hydrolase family protein [Carboxylicivirga sediminis]MBR8535357.1 fumarylacetoacetate hydrolase family protein [Carboxylicivirga sediminis]